MTKNIPRVGSIAWTDLTVPDATTVREFYAKVVGWHHEPVAGGCHARGSNADLPPQWLNYIVVADLDESMNACQDLGGSVIAGPKHMDDTSRYCVIRDPAGAVVALFATTG